MRNQEVDDRFQEVWTVSSTAILRRRMISSGILEQGRSWGLNAGNVVSSFSPRADCYHCLSSDMEWFEVSGIGEALVIPQTRIWARRFEGRMSHISIAIWISEIIGFLAGSQHLADNEIKVGMQMKAVVNKCLNDK